MDIFLREIHTEIFKQWILLNKESDYDVFVDGVKSNIIVIKNKYSYSQIIFNEMDIIELCVTDLVDGNVEFYLHFQMTTLKHAIELFREMLESIRKLNKKPIIKVLLACSGGFTTGYFAQKLNDTAKFLSTLYTVNAIGYNNLFNVGDQYDVILLAPQISYMHAKVQEILKDQLVLNIPSKIFATYDVGAMFTLIKESLSKKKKINHELIGKPLSLKAAKYNDKKILCLSLIRNSERVHIVYRLYDEKNRTVLDNEIIKLRMSLQDIFDIVDTIVLQYPDIKIVGMTMPGIINDGYITSTNIEGLKNIHLDQIFQSRYSQKLVISNDVNATAVGYYASQNKYSSLSFLFQPIAAYSGVGNIVGGKLLSGRSNIAGEVQYLPLELSDHKLVLNKTPEGAIELATKTILSIISILDPEAIVLGCVLIPQVDDLKRELEKYLPKEYIPEIIKVERIQEYILLGQLLLCLQNS